MEQNPIMAAVNNFFDSVGNLPEVNANAASAFLFHAHYNELKRKIFLFLFDQDESAKNSQQMSLLREKSELEASLREAKAFIAVMSQPEERYEPNQVEGHRKVACAVCYRAYSGSVRPVVGVCGHSICKSCKVLLVGSKDCPICRDGASFYYAERNYLAEELLTVLHPEAMLLEEETIPEWEETESRNSDEEEGGSVYSAMSVPLTEQDSSSDVEEEEDDDEESDAAPARLYDLTAQEIISHVENEEVAQRTGEYVIEHMVSVGDDFFDQDHEDQIILENGDAEDTEEDVNSVFEADEQDTLDSRSQLSDDADYSYYNDEESTPGDAMSALEDDDYVNDAQEFARQWLRMYYGQEEEQPTSDMGQAVVDNEAEERERGFIVRR